MPIQSEHVSAAEANTHLATTLLDLSPAWSIVVTFYAALHWVDAFLATFPLHPENHVERNYYVGLSPLAPIFPSYIRLSNRSREARYDLRSFARDAASQHITVDLARIRDHIRSLI
jgi:hypothetical protein